MKLILASNNANKLKEFRSLVADLDIELLSQKEAGCDFEVEETGTTFEENAYLKASAVTEATGIAAASDEERYRYLLQKMEGVEDRSARFVCCICCTFPDGSVIRSRGECEGEILLAPKGQNGFGYDPVFHPLCLDKSMAELNPEEKNAISHRGKALRAFIEELRKL